MQHYISLLSIVFPSVGCINLLFYTYVTVYVATATRYYMYVVVTQDRTSEQEDSGDLRINAHFLTLRCSILTRRRIDGHPLNPAINARRRRRSGPMNRESWMWNMERSLHLCSAPLAEWEGLPGHFMPVLPTSYPSNDRPDMQQQWD